MRLNAAKPPRFRAENQFLLTFETCGMVLIMELNQRSERNHGTSDQAPTNRLSGTLSLRDLINFIFGLAIGYFTLGW